MISWNHAEQAYIEGIVRDAAGGFVARVPNASFVTVLENTRVMMDGLLQRAYEQGGGPVQPTLFDHMTPPQPR